MKEFTKEHSNEIVLITSLIAIAVITGILVTASGKALVMEFDGINSSVQDGDGNYEEKHFDGGRLKFYAE